MQQHCRPQRSLPAFAPGDDPAPAIFDRVLLHVRARVPGLAHHPLHELEVLFGDLRNEIAEIIDASIADASREVSNEIRLQDE